MPKIVIFEDGRQWDVSPGGVILRVNDRSHKDYIGGIVRGKIDVGLTLRLQPVSLDGLAPEIEHAAKVKEISDGSWS